jgi:hypothetical protein
MTSNRERSSGAGHVGLQPGGDGRDVDAVHVGAHGGRTVPAATRGCDRPGRPPGSLGSLIVWPSTSPTQPSRPKSSTARMQTCRSSSTCGRSGAARAARSARSSRSVVDATGGKVVLVKVDTDENPAISQAFQVQSIPAVFATEGRPGHRRFRRRLPRAHRQQFVDVAVPTEGEQHAGAAAGRGHRGSVPRGARDRTRQRRRHRRPRRAAHRPGENEQALQFLARIPETEHPHVATPRPRLTRVHIAPSTTTTTPRSRRAARPR